MHDPQHTQAIGYYVASVCSGLSCVPLWLATNKDAITAACAIIGVTASLVFGVIGLAIQLRRGK